MQECLQKAPDLPLAFHVLKLTILSFQSINKLLNVRPQMGFSWWGLGSKALLEKQEG